MKILFKTLKILAAVVAGFALLIFLYAQFGSAPQSNTESAQRTENTKESTESQSVNTLQQQKETKKEASATEDPETFMQQVSNKGDKQISMRALAAYIDIYSCPEDGCDLIGSVPFMRGMVDVFVGPIERRKDRNWAKATYYGAFCAPNDLDRKTGLCSNEYKTPREITGWVDFDSLDREKTFTFKDRQKQYPYENIVKYRLFELNCKPSGHSASEFIENSIRYQIEKYFDEESKKEIRENVEASILKKYNNIDDYCSGEMAKYLNAQQIQINGAQ